MQRVNADPVRLAEESGIWERTRQQRWYKQTSHTRTEGEKENMGRIEDLKETAPCGMEIHYTVDENDMNRVTTT